MQLVRVGQAADKGACGPLLLEVTGSKGLQLQKERLQRM
jgi:hypothetical protein